MRRQAAVPPDAEASLRAELAAQIDGAQSDIDGQLTQLRAAAASSEDHGALAQAQTQLAGLTKLKNEVGRKDAQGLSALRGAVAASVAVAQMLVAQMQASPATGAAAGAQLAQASAAARTSVTDFTRAYYEQRVFDPYLKFASREDEDEYRKREAEYRREIEKARAEHSVQGDLRALDLSVEQLKDAGAHGANKSSQYKPMLDAMQNAQRNLSKAMSKDQGSAKTADASLDPDAEQPALPAGISPEVAAQARSALATVTPASSDAHGTTPAPMPATGAARGR